MSDTMLVTDFVFDGGDQHLIREAAGPDWRVEFVINAAEMQRLLPQAEVLCTFQPPRNLLTIAPKLRWFQYTGAGIDTLPMGSLNDASFIISSASSANAGATAEYVLSLMLIFARKWDELFRLQSRSEWATGQAWGALRGFELQDKTLGIIGLGGIGRRIARMARAFGMHVAGVRRTSSLDEVDLDCDTIYSADQLTTLLSTSDFVLVSVPLIPTTTGLINIAELRSMRPNAFLINVSRGDVVNERALIRALQERWIAGAGLDVVGQEPLPHNSPLWTLPGVIVTPHLSGMTTGYSHRVAELFAENIRHYRNQEPLLHQVDPVRGY